MSGRARFLQLVVSLVVGGACLFFAFQNVPAAETKNEIARVPIWAHASFVALMVFQFVVRTERFRIQVRGVAGRDLPRREALAINAVGFAAVFLFPFRLGELVRPVLTVQRGLMSKSAGIALSAVERVVDGLVTTAFFGAVLVLLGDVALPEYVRAGGVVALAAFGGASVVLFVAARWHAASVRFWTAVFTPINARLAGLLVGMLERFLEGLRCFPNGRALASYLFLSVLFWFANGAGVHFLLLGLGVDAGFVAAYFSLCFLVIGVMIPAPPGNLGNFHYFAKLSLTLLGVPAAPALAYAVLSHGWHVIALILWAGFFLVRGDVRIGSVTAATRESEAASTAGT